MCPTLLTMAILLKPFMFELEIHVPIFYFFAFEAGRGPPVIARQTIIGIVVFGLQPTMKGTVEVTQVTRYADVNIIVGVLIVVEC